MSGIKMQRIVLYSGLFAAFGPEFNLSGAGQAIAFEPQVSPFFSGPFIGVTPVVSADRRYVRLSMNASFNKSTVLQPIRCPRPSVVAPVDQVHSLDWED